jgi:hypothetical protein
LSPLLLCIINEIFPKGKLLVNRIGLLQSKRKGSAIALVLLAIVILSVMGIGLLSLGLHSRIFATITASEIEARCAVDAGLTKAVFEMNERLKVKPWDDSNLPQATDETLPNFEAIYSYAVTGDVNNGHSVESIGNSGRVERRANCNLQLQGPFEHAILVQGILTLKSDTLVDGYNSQDSGVTDVEVQIGTNSTLSNSITLNFGVTVDGDVLVGVDGDVEDVIQDLGATTDAEYAMTEEIEFPPITVPVLLNQGTGISIHGKTLTIGPTDSGKYTAITLKKAANPGILEIDGGDVVLHITGNIDLGQDCELIVRPDASLTLYVDGDLLAGNSAGINNENVPSNFKLYGTGQDQTFNIKAKTSMSGVVYAPNADIIIMAEGDVYGSFIGNSFEMKAGGNFYYDEALRNVSVNDESVRFVTKQWTEE